MRAIKKPVIKSGMAKLKTGKIGHTPLTPTDSTKINYFKDLVSSIREPLLVLGKDLRVLSANHSFYNFFKVNKKETLGALIYDLGDGQWDIHALRLLLETILPQKAVFNDYEVEHDFPNIGRRILLLNARRIPGPPKDAQWILLSFEDVTQRMRLERTLQVSEARFRGAFETAQDTMLLIEKTNGRILYSNQVAQDSLGYSTTAIRKKNLWELGILKDELNFRQTAFELEERGSVGMSDRAIPTRRGSLFPADVSFTNRATVIQCNIRDISERKRAEQALLESEEKYRTLVDEVNDGIYVTDVSGVFTFTNPALARIYGFETPQTLIGRKFMDFIAPGVMAELSEPMRSMIHTGMAPEIITGQIVRPDGKPVFIEVKAVSILQEGRIVGSKGVVRDITERKQREVEIQSRTTELRALYQLSRLLADANDLTTVIELVNRYAMESILITFAGIAMVEGDDLLPMAVYPVRSLGQGFDAGLRQPFTALPICHKVLETNEPVIVKAGDPGIGSAERRLLLLDFAQSVCLVPLRDGGSNQALDQRLGLLILGETRREEREPFTPEKLHLACSIGDQAASAIRRMLLHEQARLRLQHLAALSEIDRTIVSVLDLRLSLQLILKNVHEQLAVDAADVLVLNDSILTLEFTAGIGFRTPSMAARRLRLNEGQAGKAVLERKMVQIPDLVASQARFAYPNIIQSEQIGAYFAVPLISKGKIKGVLEVYQRSSFNPNEEWLDYLNILAEQAAIAIDNVQMFENLQRSTDELELAYDATIEGWSHALDLRDKETGGHTLRVTEVTMKLGRNLGLSEVNLQQVRWGALLHDIGKMGIPDAILLKPGLLTDEEWVIMKKHPGLAYQLLEPIHYLSKALDIPYCHHEKWDGSGYPRGLKGEQIPLAARIFAVVDVWDALTSDRPYRHAWSEEKARLHIQAEAGKHFDPQVVETFFQEQG